jgi:hypothetical protein
LYMQRRLEYMILFLANFISIYCVIRVFVKL